jgi:PTS system nitrogen regulatory IIA component
MGISFVDFLPEANIIALHGKKKKEVIDELVKFAAESCDLDEGRLRDVVWERENQLSTALGHGLAVPHARMKDIGDPVVVMGICPDKVDDYCGIDKEGVSLAILIVSDCKDHQLYLDILQSVSSKLLEDEKLIRRIIKNKSDQAGIKTLLTA